jgi:hypothetical protein
MDSEKIEIIIEESSVGPVANHMLNYSDKDFDSYVIREMSDDVRRDIAIKQAEFVETLSEVFGRAAVDKKSKYLREELVDVKNVMADIECLRPPKFEIDKFRPQRANFSGIEFFDLVKVAITLGGSALTVAMVKAIKDIIIAWIKARSARKLTFKIGTTSLTIQGNTTQQEVHDIIARLDAIAAMAKPAKEKAVKEKPPAIEKAETRALPPPKPQPPGKPSTKKKKTKQKQQS